MTPLDARQKIVQAANRHRVRSGLGRVLKLYNMRQIQQAVCVCRHHRLVSAEILKAAGYRPVRRRT